MDEQEQKRYPVNSVRLCFTKRNSEEFEGRICGVALEDVVTFEDAAQLIVKVDSVFDRIGHPQPHQILRSFGEDGSYRSYCGTPKRYHTDEEINAMRGDEGTFELVMLTRHSAEWQGILRDVDDQKTQKFETILECVRILNKTS